MEIEKLQLTLHDRVARSGRTLESIALKISFNPVFLTPHFIVPNPKLMGINLSLDILNLN